MTKTERTKRNKHARRMYEKACKALGKEPTVEYNHMSESMLTMDIQGKYLATRSRRRRKLAMMSLGLTRKQARRAVRRDS